jgi:hypothetical protein
MLFCPPDRLVWATPSLTPKAQTRPPWLMPSKTLAPRSNRAPSDRLTQSVTGMSTKNQTGNNMQVRSREARIAAALAYSNPKVVRRLQINYGHSQTTANQIFFDTKQFLVMCAFENGKFTPSRKIDEGFHEFLMYSRDFDEFCQNLLPRKVYHVPDEPNTPTDASRTQRTLAAGKRFFGKHAISDNWSGDSADCEAAGCHCD